jgi:hypothetical protein
MEHLFYWSNLLAASSVSLIKLPDLHFALSQLQGIADGMRDSLLVVFAFVRCFTFKRVEALPQSLRPMRRMRFNTRSSKGRTAR